MKKILALFIIIILGVGLVSCEAKQEGSHRLPGKGKKDIVDKQLEQVITAIKDKDREAIISLFSKDALAQITDMDQFEKSIDELINTFPNWDGEYDGWNALKIREYAHMSMDNNSHYYYEPDFDFTVDGVEYEFHLVMVYKADDTDKVGLSVIQINHEDISPYKTPGYYCRPHETTTPGVYCWDCEIK